MGIKILLADDSVTAQNMGKKILSEAGHDVVTVSNGAAAAKKIAEIKPDLVLLDVFMPGYSGLELCEKLRNGADTSKLPVLLTVGRMEPYSAQDGARVRADGIIIKPFEATDLTAAVERLTSKSKSPKTLAWKADAKTDPSTTAPDSNAAEKPKSYDETMRLDPAEIARMLAAKPAPAPAPSAVAPAINSDLTDPAAEEFNVTPLGRREALPAHAATPAFAEDLPNAIPSAPATVNAAMVPAFAMEEIAPAAAPEQSAPAASKSFVVETFEAESATAPVVSAEGLEPTAVAPVPEMPIASEAALEPTLQSAAADTVIVKDPALETDPHRSATEFITQFGTAESAEPPVAAMHHTSVSDSVIESSDAVLSSALSSFAPETPQAPPPDDFETRLKAAMSAYDQPSAQPEVSAVMESQPTATNPVEIGMDAAPSFPVMPELVSSMEEEHSSVTPISGGMHSEIATNDSQSFGLLPELVVSDEETHAGQSQPEFTPLALDDAEPHSAFSPVTHQAEKEESIAEAADSFLKAVSAAQLTPTHQTDASELEIAAPESDDSVIQQMRNALSELPVDRHSEAEAHIEPAPMAMAAAAGSAPTSASLSRESEIDITQALADSMKSVEGAIPITAGHRENGDANHVASAVDHVLQRELPSLVWKIMAELDLRKNRP